MNFNEFPGVNAAYAEELFERFRVNPESVDTASREWFRRRMSQRSLELEEFESDGARKIVAVVMMAQAIRNYGHLAAHLDALGATPRGDPSLEMETYGLTDENLQLLPAELIGGPAVVLSSWEDPSRLAR
jgi:2-oxoglutarate dehydrogenase E1 component